MFSVINLAKKHSSLKENKDMPKPPNCSPSFSLIFFLTQLIFLPVFHTQASSSSKEDHRNCPPTRCSSNGPEIRFPFRLKRESACGYPDPALELSCTGKNETALHIWPSSPDDHRMLIVHEIDYKEATMQVSTPDGCPIALFFNRTLSSSPFRFLYPYNYTVIECSEAVDNLESRKDSCLSSFSHNVYWMYSDYYYVDDMPLSCHSVKTIEVDNWYNIYEGIVGLKWELPLCKHCDQDGSGRSCYTKNMTTRDMGCHQGIHKELIITGVTLGLFGIVLIGILIGVKAYKSLKYSKLDREYQLKVEKFLEDYESLKPTRYTFHEIKRMTNSFRTKLGEGGYGSVFKGELPNGVLVAVKLLNGSNCFADGDEFINEVGTIGRIHHVNVVRLLGFCVENLKRALVYEFMPNESLEKFIIIRRDPALSTNNSAAGPLFLGWEKLEEIAIGIARGIEYLHQGCDHRILHFDIKPHNILLDDNFVPKVSDFGLAKMCSKGQSIVSVTAARGTMGYIAPEVFSRNFGNVSHKSDVYSFGMLLLEMVGGRKKVDETAEVEAEVNQVYFPEWIYKHYLKEGLEELEGTATLSDDQAGEDDQGVQNIMTNISNNNIARKLSIVGLWCIQWYPVDRPCMHTVVQMLKGSGEGLTVPPSPFNSSASNPQEGAPRRAHFSHLSIINE